MDPFTSLENPIHYDTDERDVTDIANIVECSGQINLAEYIRKLNDRIHELESELDEKDCEECEECASNEQALYAKEHAISEFASYALERLDSSGVKYKRIGNSEFVIMTKEFLEDLKSEYHSYLD